MMKIGSGDPILPTRVVTGLLTCHKKDCGYMYKEEPRISCKTFQKQELVIKDITDKINQAKGVVEKARFAVELQKEVDVLLSCLDYEKEKLDCKSCHFIASLRKETANLIIKAKKLA